MSQPNDAMSRLRTPLAPSKPQRQGPIRTFLTDHPKVFPNTLAVVLVLGVIWGVYALFNPLISQHGAVTMPLDWCGHVFEQKYSQAYGMLTDDTKRQISLSAFTQDVQGWRLTHCSTEYDGPRVLSSPTQIPMTFVQDNGGDTGLTNGSVTIVQVDSSWKIQSIVTPWGSIP